MLQIIFRILVIVVIIMVVVSIIATLGITFNFSFGGYASLLLSFLQIVCYVLPFKRVLPILIAVISIVIFKITVSLIKTIWQLLPIRG